MNDLIICKYLVDSLLEFQDDLNLMLGEHLKYHFEDLYDFADDLTFAIINYGRQK